MTIRDRVLRALHLNREPGFHFAGNFLDISYDVVGKGGTVVTLEAGPHCLDGAGAIDAGVVAVAADIALATSVRAALGSSTTRLATVGMHLQFTGAPLQGMLRASGTFEGFAPGAQPQGTSRVSIQAGSAIACFGTGAFMALEPPQGVRMHPVATRRRRDARALDEAELDAGEREILRRADAALEQGEPGFLTRFFGYAAHPSAEGARCVLHNGAHVANRVGHVQGGILVGLAGATARTALASGWATSAISACFVSPGEGEALEALARVVHRGRHTAVVRTEVSGPAGRRVLEVMSSHSRHEA